MLLAWVGRSRHLREASWLVYPVLALGALKLLVEDFPAGRPMTLLVALALYGGALIAAPRLRRRRGQRSEGETQTPVPRIVRRAHVALAADHGDADGGSRPEKSDFEGAHRLFRMSPERSRPAELRYDSPPPQCSPS